MNNPEPFLVVKSTHDISIKKALSKMKSFLENASNETESTTSQIRVGKISDELVEKLQMMYAALQSQSEQQEEQKHQHQSQKKSSKKRQEPDAAVEEEEIKPKKKKSRKSSASTNVSQ
jgi:DNA-binding transcriptional regulator YbjK